MSPTEWRWAWGGLHGPLWVGKLRGRRGAVTWHVYTCSSDVQTIFLGSKITADGDCSHEIKRRLLLGRKLMTNLDSIFNNLRYADDATLMAESEEELKSLLMKVKEESEKVGLKLNIHKMKIMASGPINSWEIDGETVETVSDFIFWGLQKSPQMVTAAMKLKDTYSLEGKL